MGKILLLVNDVEVFDEYIYYTVSYLCFLVFKHRVWDDFRKNTKVISIR